MSETVIYLAIQQRWASGFQRWQPEL